MSTSSRITVNTDSCEIQHVSDIIVSNHADADNDVIDM